MSLRFLPALLAAIALAAGAPKSDQVTPPSKVATPALEGPTRSIVGEVTYVDVALRIVAVRETVSSASQKGQKPVRRTLTMVLTPDTKLVRGKTPSDPAELRVRDYVVAHYRETPYGPLAVTLRVADVVARSVPSPITTDQDASSEDTGQRE
ncbi:MAG: hypothetical protein ACHQPI_04390 [Thermoanaerobaculia bacterium]